MVRRILGLGSLHRTPQSLVKSHQMPASLRTHFLSSATPLQSPGCWCRQLLHTFGSLPYFLDWLAHPAYDDYWKRLTIEDHYPDIGVPALHVAAWYDIFLGAGSLRNYTGLKANAATEESPAKASVFSSPSAATPVTAANWRPRTSAPKPQNTTNTTPPSAGTYFLFKGIQNEFATGSRHDFRHGPQSMVTGRRLAARSSQDHPVFSALAGCRQLFPRQWLSFPPPHRPPKPRGQVHL